MRQPAMNILLYAALALAIVACVDVPREAPPDIGVVSMFDPATSTIPLPNDLLKDPKTGLLSIPVSTTDSPLTVEVKGSLARLDGWLTSQTITIPFDGLLDESTLTPDTVMLFDITNGTADKVDPATYVVAFNVGVMPAAAAPYYLTIKNKRPSGAAVGTALPAGYVQGHKYFAVVTGGVKGKDGKPVTANAVYELLKSTAVLADAQGRSLTVLSPTDPAGKASLIQLENARADVYDPAFKMTEAAGILKRRDAVAFTAFSVQGGSSTRRASARCSRSRSTSTTRTSPRSGWT